jgi:hypothetical protein
MAEVRLLLGLGGDIKMCLYENIIIHLTDLLSHDMIQVETYSECLFLSY